MIFKQSCFEDPFRVLETFVSFAVDKHGRRDLDIHFLGPLVVFRQFLLQRFVEEQLFEFRARNPHVFRCQDKIVFVEPPFFIRQRQVVFPCIVAQVMPQVVEV